MRNRLLVLKDGLTYDASSLMESCRWEGRIASPSRCLRVRLLDSEKNAGGRLGINVENGQRCIFLRDDKELFRGMFMRQEQGYDRMMTLTAYDNGIYLSNNKGAFNYTNKTASFIFKDVCRRFNIPYSGVAETGYIVAELPQPRSTGYDVICDALEASYYATGKRYFIKCEKENMSLIRRVENVVQWVIASGSNLMSYNYSKDIEHIKTRIKLLNRDDYVVVERSDKDLESRIGIFQEIAAADDSLTGGKLRELALNMLQEKSMPEKNLSVDALGNTEIVTGVCVYVVIPHLGLEKSFYVESDRHSFSEGTHTMSVSLAAVGEADM